MNSVRQRFQFFRNWKAVSRSFADPYGIKLRSSCDSPLPTGLIGGMQPIPRQSSIEEASALHAESDGADILIR